MSWAYPFTLWALIAVAGLSFAGYMAGRRARRKLRTIGRDGVEWQVRVFLRDISIAAFFALGVLAAAEPRGGRQAVSGERSGLDVAVVFDVSRSMLAQDISPSRLDRGVAAIGQITRVLEGSRFSLVPFKGEAVPIVPMTEDRVILELWIERLGPGLSTIPGTDIELALRAALETFPGGVGRSQIIILVTDGEAISGRVDLVSRELAEQSIPVHSLMTGTLEGATIPLSSGVNVVDESDRPVISRADYEVLEQLADSTGGSVHDLTRPGAVAELIDVVEKDREFVESRGIRFTGIYRYRTFLIPAIVMLFFNFLARIVPWRRRT